MNAFFQKLAYNEIKSGGVEVQKHLNKSKRIGFGGWQLGNPLWGDMSDTDGIKLVKLAVKKGVYYFDTAPGYGDGKSETLLGEALKDVRTQVFINTKIGHLADGTSNFHVSSLEGQIKMSLSRLQTSYLDSVLLHNPSFDILLGQTDHFTELNRLKTLGYIKHYGVSIDTYDELKAVLENTDVEVVEILFNIFFQSPAPLFDLAKEKGVKLLVKVPLDSGWLTGKYNENSTFTGIRSRWSKEDIKRRATLVTDVKNITQKNELTDVALAFILKFDQITAIIPGIKNETQLDINLNAEHYELTDEMFHALIDLYQNKIKNHPCPW